MPRAVVDKIDAGSNLGLKIGLSQKLRAAAILIHDAREEVEAKAAAAQFQTAQKAFSVA